MSIVIETTKGVLTVDLYTKHRPKVCQNFLKLCKVKYYNYHLFHSIQRDFLAQSGDPIGNGRGGESIFGRLYGEQARFFEGDPLVPKIKHTKPGLISMVNTGSNLYGSQFFITLGTDSTYLDDQQHCVFGEVVEGLELLDTLNEIICDKEGRPYQDIRISHTVILDDPFEDPSNLQPPSRSPSPDPEFLKTDRLAADEDFEEYEGKTAEELGEISADKEAKARATILEMIGDLPAADCAPPENVLFVCKLNPVTTDEDLEIIFARFGKVVNCEVIRDQKTEDSLQYAFIEFDCPEACEKAYFKMDNVLIDDRRIHVDFSQSVSKYKWKGKGRLEVVKEKSSRRKYEDKKYKSEDKQHYPQDSRRDHRDSRRDNTKDRRDYHNKDKDSDRDYNKDRYSGRRDHNKDHRDSRKDNRHRSRSRDRSEERRHNRKDREWSRDCHQSGSRYEDKASSRRRSEKDSYRSNQKKCKKSRRRSSSRDSSS